MNKLLPACAALAAAVAVSVHADEVPPNAIIVTATRTAQTVDETLAAVTVFDREDIERSQAKTVAELLTGSAGIDASISGGYGKATSIFLRGTNADHVVVLLDGVRIGSATLGTAPWQYLPLAQIDRVEVVRGPRSSLYGADAIGGVIQIFTRKGEQGVRGGISSGHGTYSSREYSADVSGAHAGFHYSAAAARSATDGINARTVQAANEPDDDGYRNDSFSTRLGYRFSNRTEIQAHMLHAQGSTEFDSTFSNETDFIQNVIGVDFRTAPMDKWDIKLQAARNRDETDDLFNGDYRSTFNTDRRLFSWQNDISVAAKHLVSIGVDKQADRIQSSSTFNATSRDNTGYFMQYQAGTGAHDFLLGARRDDNQAFGEHGTGNVAWGWAIDGERLRLLASYGTAFKAPTFNQLFHPSVGNPNLKPEESKTAEIGLRGKTGGMAWGLHAFQTHVDNLIVFLPPSFQAINIGRARIRGLETQTSLRHGNNLLTVHYTQLDPRDEDTGALLPRRVKNSLKLDDEYKLGRWRLGGAWIVQSYRYDNPQNTIRVGGYGVVDLRARYDIDKDWFVQGRAGNIFDKPYETVATFNSPGRNFFVTVGYRYQ